MRLIELGPKWMGAGGDGVFDASGNSIPRREGIGLFCEKCPCGKCEDPLYVRFSNPIDGEPSLAHDRSPGWERTGETFETLTLRPSIQRVGGCGWHGFITNGEVVKA